MIFQALKYPNLRLFLFGQLCSLVGTWMQIVAGSWLIYRLTDSPWLLGVFAFAMNFPTLLFSPLAGVAADRFDRRNLLILVNILSMVQAFVLWLLVFTGVVQLWHLMALSMVLGVLNAYELPLRQSLISQLVDDHRDLPNAIALNSSVFNGSRLVGPAVAGAVISFLGEGICFLVNALSFLPVIATLLAMRLTAHRHVNPQGQRNSGIRAGFFYVRDSMPIRLLLIMVSILSMVSGAFYALAPVFARDVFGGGPKTLGYLLSVSGFGAFLGAAYLAGRRTVIGLGRTVAVAGIAAGAAYMVFAVYPDIRIASCAVFLCGFCVIASIGGMNIIIQTLVDEHMRGRVMSMYALALVGISPFGSLAAGAVATRAGEVSAMFFAGVLAMAAMGYFWFRLPRFRAKVRPIYARKGIFPEA